MGAGDAVVLSGGVAHDFPATSARVAELLAGAGFAPQVTEDVDAVLAGLSPDGRGPLVVLDMLRWTMTAGRYADQRERWGLSLSAAARAGLDAHVRGGGGLLALHGASICFDDWPGWADLLGATWRWGASGHPPLGPVRVAVLTGTHPVVEGVGDFDVVDEVYSSLDVADDVRPLMTAAPEGVAQPLLWARTVGRGRVVYDALGHHPPSYDVADHVRIVQRAARWAAGLLPPP